MNVRKTLHATARSRAIPIGHVGLIWVRLTNMLLAGGWRVHHPGTCDFRYRCLRGTTTWREMVEISLTSGEALQRAMASHQAGNLGDAERLYRSVLRANPNQIDALHLMGMIEYQRGNHNDAIRLIDMALAIKPDFAVALNNRGNALCALNRLPEALKSFDKALSIRPNYAEALNNRGNTLGALNRWPAALESFDKALAIKPDYAEALNNRGNALGLQSPLAALASYDQALAIKPDFAVALNNRGNALEALNRRLEALESFDKALAIMPDYVEALNNRGNVLAALNRRREALESFDKALAIKPDYAEALNNRGEVLRALHRQKEALAAYGQALAIKPDFAMALNNRGISLAALKRRPEALENFDKALAIQPDYAEALNNRGDVLCALHRQEEALANFNKALAIKPNFAAALNSRGNVLLKLGHRQLAVESYEKALSIKPDAVIHSNLIFAFNFDPTATAVRHQAERSRWNEQYAQFSRRPHDNHPDPLRRLRVGYVSSHFRSQASTYAFGGVLLCHDPNYFEVICYSDTLHEDDVTARLRAGAHRWHDTRGLSDDEFADQVRADGIDILVDCVGHMSDHRLLVFARKPAPIQVTAWGEPTGTGLKAIDYLLADPVLVPASERALLAERVFDLPNFLGYWAPDPLPEPVALPAMANGYITFGSFNRFEKIQEPVLRSWAAVLRLLPNSRLVLKGDQRHAEFNQRARILSLFGEEGIGPERVKLLDQTNRPNHFADYQGIDIALDPFPHGGGMTTLDALWMGVPVVTWCGQTISSRLAAASLTALDLTDFIASDLESYVNLAVAKAAGLDTLAKVRGSLRARVAGSVIGDPIRYARAVEAAYREIWRRWCAAIKAGPNRE